MYLYAGNVFTEISLQMFNKEEFRKQAYELVDWITEYMEGVEKFPVRSPLNYGDIRKSLPAEPPENSETFDYF